MAFDPMGFLLASVQAEREGVSDPQARSRLALLGGLAGSPVTGLVLTTVLARNEGEPQSASSASRIVQIPQVEEKGLMEAREYLESLGLRVRTQRVYNKRFSEGVVTSQEPDGGALALEGAQVTLYVSRGTDRKDAAATSQDDSAGETPAAAVAAAPGASGKGNRRGQAKVAAESRTGSDNGESSPQPA